MVKNEWSSPPVCVHGVNESNVTFGKEGSVSNILVYELRS
jgi:hypothetical protein